MKKNVLKWLGRVGATLLTTIVILVVGLYGVMAMLAWGPSKVAKKQFIMSLQETGELGFTFSGSKSVTAVFDLLSCSN